MPPHDGIDPPSFAEVAELDAREVAAEHEYVVELDVAMHQLAAVHVLHGGRELPGHPLRVQLAQPRLCHVGREVA